MTGRSTPMIAAGAEDEILGVFVDVAALFRRTSAGGDSVEFGRGSTEEYLFTYLRDLASEGRGLPAAFLDQLRRTLRHYAVPSLEPSPKLDEALYRIARSQRRMDRQLGPVIDLLESRLAQAEALREDVMCRALLGRVIDESRQRHPGVHDLAQEVWYRTFDQPFLQDVRARAYADAAAHVEALAGDPDGPARAEHVHALVECSQPLKTLLSARFADASTGLRDAALLEVMTRRYYRVGAIHDLRTLMADGHPVAMGSCTIDAAPVHVLSTHVDADDVRASIATLGGIARGFGDDLDVLVDLYVWRGDEPAADLDAYGAECKQWLDADLPETVTQVVISLSSPSSGPGTSGVRHLTFRRGGDGFEEDRLYRTMHPMMGRRLELWRLQNFDLEPVPSVEDVYVLRGTAHENPRDERLFVLAEVRDFTAVRDASARSSACPSWSGCTWRRSTPSAGCRATGRPTGAWSGTGSCSTCGHPSTSARAEISALVQQLAPAVEGLGLEKVAVHGRLVTAAGDEPAAGRDRDLQPRRSLGGHPGARAERHAVRAAHCLHAEGGPAAPPGSHVPLRADPCAGPAHPGDRQRPARRQFPGIRPRRPGRWCR